MSRKALSDLDFGGLARCVNLLDPVSAQDAATKAHVAATAAALMKKQVGWAPTTAGDLSSLLELLAAGHAAGLYLVTLGVYVRTGATGNLSWTVGWSQANGVGATTATTPSNSTLNHANVGPAPVGSGTSTKVQAPTLLVESDGVNAITARFTANTTASPVLDVYAAAHLVGR